MRKKALLALLLVLSLVLSGCALIKKDAAVDAARVIMSYGGRNITKSEVLVEANSQLQSMAYMYSLYGMSFDATDASNIQDAIDAAVEDLKEDLVLKAKIDEKKIADQLTEDDLAEIQSGAQSSYDYAVSYAKTMVEDQTLEGDALEEAAKKILDERQVTLEDYAEDEKESKLKELLRADVIKDVTVSDDEVQAEYDSKVQKDQETYAENAGSWASAANNGSTLYYVPAGIRRVKQILIKFTDEDQSALDEANSAVTTATSRVTAAQQIIDGEDYSEEEKTQAQADLAAAQADLDAANQQVTDLTEKAYADIDAAADEVLQQLADGADWDTLMAEKTQDPGMQSGRATAETGYAVSADMTNFDSAFVEAAMALQAIGDVSPKTRGSSNGYYIIRYVGDETEGPVALDRVKEDLHESLLSSKQDETYNTTVEEWITAANIKVDTNALKD